MRQTLLLHSDSRCKAVTSIEVQAARPNSGKLLLRYIVTGEIIDLRLSPVATPARTDELWRHTCFEAFIRPSPGSAYYEFNFSPSMQWAAHSFTDYREGMRVVDEIRAPRLEVTSNGESYELKAALELEGLPDPPSDGTWRLGLSAVIEETSGRKSYWALSRPPGKPDFHQSDCFALELPPMNSR